VAALREQVLTLAGIWLAARRYLAPECLHQGQAADIRSDIYSLGVILGELLTGRSAWSGTSSSGPAMEEGQHLLPVRLGQDVRLLPSLERVLRQALAEDPGRCFQRVSDLLAAFAEGLEEETPEAITCWFCPLHPAVGTREPEAEHQRQEDELLDSTPFPWEVPHAPPPVEASALFSRTQPGQPHNQRFLAHERMRARKGRLHPHRSRQISRRRLVKGLAFGALGASVLSSGYLLTIALLKPPLPQGPAGVTRSRRSIRLRSLPFHEMGGRGCWCVCPMGPLWPMSDRVRTWACMSTTTARPTCWSARRMERSSIRPMEGACSTDRRPAPCRRCLFV
jgi:hypothetical protein